MKKTELQAKLLESVLKEYRDKESSLSASKANVLQAVGLKVLKWNVSEDKDKMMDIENTIWQTRGYFQPTCSEWNRTILDEKVTQLKNLKSEGFNTLELALRMKMIGNNDFSKDISDLDLILGMSEIIDYLLEKNE